MPTDKNILMAAEAIAAAETILITAGAGIGVDSGLPDFRGHQGFWKIHPKYAEEGLTFVDLADPKWFETHPDRAWGFYGYRYNLYRNTVPHQGFQLLKKWQDRAKRPGFVYTSNVDGQFQKAGFAPDSIYECHGSIHHLQCCTDCRKKIWPAGNLVIEVDPVNLLAKGELPRCPNCGVIARPNILMFGDPDWAAGHAGTQRQRYYEWKPNIADCNVVIIEIGAGYTIGRVRSIGEYMPGTLIRINPRDPKGPEGTISIAMPALAALTAIDQALQKIALL
jgi:NAD-dependent SIR2 family protein deacetylase